MGQKREVTTVRFYIRDSFEEVSQPPYRYGASTMYGKNDPGTKLTKLYINAESHGSPREEKKTGIGVAGTSRPRTRG